MIDGRYHARVKYVKKKNFLLKLCVSLPVIAVFFCHFFLSPVVVAVVIVIIRMKSSEKTRKKNLLLLWIRLFSSPGQRIHHMYQAVQVDRFSYKMMNYFDIIYIIKHIDNISLRILINSVAIRWHAHTHIRFHFIDVYFNWIEQTMEKKKIRSTHTCGKRRKYRPLWILTIIHCICLSVIANRERR